MANLGEFIIVYDILPELAAKMEEVVGKVVRKTAIDLAANAKVAVDQVTERQTGFLVNSIYAETFHGNNEHSYSDVQAPSAEGQELFPEVEKPHKPTEAKVAVAANYGAYIEYGTSRMPARPWLTPTAELMQVEFMRALEKLEEKLAESVGTSSAE